MKTRLTDITQVYLLFKYPSYNHLLVTIVYYPFRKEVPATDTAYAFSTSKIAFSKLTDDCIENAIRQKKYDLEMCTFLRKDFGTQLKTQLKPQLTKLLAYRRFAITNLKIICNKK